MADEREIPEAKIDEALLFVECMERVENGQVDLRGRAETVVTNYFFSAFLSAAQSVFDYVLTPANQAGRGPQAEAWRTGWRSTMLGTHFHPGRNLNIHLSHKGKPGERPWAHGRFIEKPRAGFTRLLDQPFRSRMSRVLQSDHNKPPFPQRVFPEGRGGGLDAVGLALPDTADDGSWLERPRSHLGSRTPRRERHGT
ncbi:MAG: hypothetical protein QME77_12440 [bacterium]|nr:hypothetical protein [bacterium]